ncbi:UNVERIFIED_CONTAM: hypothetical protein GTU68_019288 [Idotea baltica]|nr:hypothetical protein [Idotea baltica]
MMDCKKALVEAEGDFDKAVEILRKKGQKVSAKRADREASEGAVFINKNAAGNEATLIELNCETDFVARNDDFQALGKDIAMQIAAMSPVAVDKDGVSQDLIQKEIEIGMEQARNEGKPEAILEKIATGKLNKYFRDNTLMNQDFVKDTSKTVKQYIKDQLGADVSIGNFKRVQLGAS